MTQEALKMALDALALVQQHLEHPLGVQMTKQQIVVEVNKVSAAIKEALAKEKTLQALHSENERLGLYKDAYAQPEQEPVAWMLTDKNINSLQVDSIQRLIDRLKHAHHTDLCVRINGQDEWFQADWLKHMVRVTPPQPEQEPRNVRERWNVELDGNDLLVCFNDHEKGDKCQYERYSPQRTWVGLTDEEISELIRATHNTGSFVRAIEAKLKQVNGYAKENT